MSKNSKNKKTTVPMGRVVVILIVVIALVPAIIGGSLFVLLTTILPAAGNRHSRPFPETPNIFYADGVSLNGIWEIESLTFNDEFITMTFNDEAFTRVSEMYIADADIYQVLETIDDIREFYARHNGGEVEVEETDDGNVLLRIIVNGVFSLTDNEIWLASGEDIVTVMPFSWDGATMVINDDIFVRR